MKIEEMIKDWFEKAKEKSSGGKTYYKQVKLDMDNLCCGVIQLMETYAESVALLLNADKKLPAKALLRIMGDLAIKCMWCLDGYETSEDEFSCRLEKWRRYSLFRYKQGIEEELRILEEEYGEEVRSLKDELKKHLEILEGEKIKRVQLSVWDLRGVWKKQAVLNFDALYRRYNDAVHPDWLVLQKLQIKDDFKILYKADVEEDVERLKAFCLVIVGFLLRAIYSINNWDFGEFEKDLSKIMGDSTRE